MSDYACDDDVEILAGDGKGKVGCVIGIGSQSCTEVCIDGKWQRIDPVNVRTVKSPTRISVLVEGTTYHPAPDEVQLVRKCP